MELFLSELKRDVSQQPAVLPARTPAAGPGAPLLSPPSTGEGSGGHRHGWDALLGTQQPRQPVPVVLHQGWWSGPSASPCSLKSRRDATVFIWRGILTHPGWGCANTEGPSETGMGWGATAEPCILLRANGGTHPSIPGAAARGDGAQAPQGQRAATAPPRCVGVCWAVQTQNKAEKNKMHLQMTTRPWARDCGQPSGSLTLAAGTDGRAGTTDTVGWSISTPKPLFLYEYVYMYICTQRPGVQSPPRTG